MSTGRRVDGEAGGQDGVAEPCRKQATRIWTGGGSVLQVVSGTIKVNSLQMCLWLGVGARTSDGLIL